MKIHIVTNRLDINSGFSIVGKNIALGLKKLGYDITASGQQQSFNPEVYYGINSYPVLDTVKDDTSQLLSNILDIEPDIILNIFQSDSGDFRDHAFIFNDVNRLLESVGNKKKIKSYWYSPIESLGLSYIGKRDLKSFVQMGGKVVGQCKFGQNEMKKEGIDSYCIYHGIDETIFRLLEDADIRNISDIEKDVSNSNLILNSINDRWTEESVELIELSNRYKNKFVFIIVANNLGVRKRIERAMNAYSIFIESSRQIRDRCHLHIHTYPMAVGGINLLDIAKRLGIEKDITFSYGKWKSGWSDTAMSVLYNISSCHLSASSGEGFCLSNIESMSCELPTIGPKNTSFIELVEEDVIGDDEKKIGPRGILCGGDYQYIIDGSERFLVNEKELANAMMTMYKEGIKDSDKYNEYKNNCLEFAKLVTWDNICDKWNCLFKEMR